MEGKCCHKIDSFNLALIEHIAYGYVVYVLANIKLSIPIVIRGFGHKCRSFVFNDKGVRSSFVIDL